VKHHSLLIRILTSIPVNQARDSACGSSGSPKRFLKRLFRVGEARRSARKAEPISQLQGRKPGLARDLAVGLGDKSRIRKKRYHIRVKGETPGA
jgi:hypothetical protein